MKRILTKTIRLVFLSVLPILAILSFSSARAIGAEQQKQEQHEFLAVLIDTASKQPVQSARIILAPKKEGKPECRIDTSLTGVSNENGEVRLQNVKPGEYVVFYNVSGILHAELNGKVVNYDPVTTGAHHSALKGKTTTTASTYMTNITTGFAHIADSFGCGGLFQLKGSTVTITDGNLVLDGYYYANCVDLAMFNLGGKLLAISVPGTGSVPVKIEINTDIRTLGNRKPN